MGCLMNSKVTIMQSVDWNKYSLEEWLYQFGAWQHSNTGTCGRSINPIAVAMDEAVVKRKAKKITSKEQIIADWINDDSKALHPKRISIVARYRTMRQELYSALSWICKVHHTF